MSWQIEFNTLNRKQFASKGHYFQAKVRYIDGKEHSVSGSTAAEEYDFKKNHQWIQISSEIQQFIFSKTFFHLGFHGKLVLNSQSLFKNYTATLLRTTEFAPVPDVFTFFLAEYRSPQHFGLGFNAIFTLKNKVDLRLDSYLYQPFKQLTKYDNGEFGYSKIFKGETFLHSLSLIYHSPIGPLRATVNYFPKQLSPLSLQLSYGFILFNERAIR